MINLKQHCNKFPSISETLLWHKNKGIWLMCNTELEITMQHMNTWIGTTISVCVKLLIRLVRFKYLVLHINALLPIVSLSNHLTHYNMTLYSKIDVSSYWRIHSSHLTETSGSFLFTSLIDPVQLIIWPKQVRAWLVSYIRKIVSDIRNIDPQ